MFHRRITVLMMVWGLVLAACGGADPGLPAGATTTMAAPAGDQGGTGNEGQVDPGPGVDTAALDIELMAGAELPEGIPVPVPAGGVPGGVAAFEGQSLSLEFPAGNLAKIGAFYDAWFADQGIEVEPNFGSGDLQLWRATVDGVPVEIELYKLTNADGEQLFISWP